MYFRASLAPLIPPRRLLSHNAWSWSISVYQSTLNPCSLKHEMNLLLTWLVSFLLDVLSALLQTSLLSKFWKIMFLKRRCLKKVDNVEEDSRQTSFVDLPDLAIEAILSLLPASSLCQMAAVCKDLKKRCQSDHLWDPLVSERWGQIAGRKAYLNWKRNVVLRHEICIMVQRNSSNLWMTSLACLWPLSWFKILGGQRQQKKKNKTGTPMDSLMAWYLALESGSVWFPAQVYNREHGHVGFMLSCYDAELCYDRMNDTFRARYPPHGPRTIVIEEGISWHRLRAPPVDTRAHDLHISECLHDLKPGDHVEVQWRRNKEFPYGWWYGVVGHADTCHRDNWHCQCHLDETLWLEFNQYTFGSRWRRAAIDRINHREMGNDAEGFYGGIRKLRTKAEILIWERLWPSEILE